jgi:OOP family OmpA-OmpF porin
MKKIVLIPALLSATLAFSQDYRFEVSPLIGYNIAEGNLGLKDNGHPLGGLEFQFNAPNSHMGAEFSLLYSPDTEYNNGKETDYTRFAFNGVYTFDKTSSVTPFAKVGAGNEIVGLTNEDNENGFFFDVGAGIKVPFTKQWALKLEAIYMSKIVNNKNGDLDNNLVTLAGLTYSFGTYEKRKAPTPTPVPVFVDGDDDGDGVLNSKDSCLYTPANTKVDALGCALVRDFDGDGVVDELDMCPNTPHGAKVNSDGCQEIKKLNIFFDFDSYHIQDKSKKDVDKYAEFLKEHPYYHAEIVGHTDSMGSEAYNKKLSKKRANAVVEELVKTGIDKDRLSSKGMGEEHPIYTNETEYGRAKNRRVETHIKK